MKTALNKILLIVLLLCLTVLPLTAQTGKFYSTNNELSSSLINQIFQDKRGFIWIATEYGLNRFDGLRFSNYHSKRNEKKTMAENLNRFASEVIVKFEEGAALFHPDGQSESILLAGRPCPQCTPA